MKLPNHSLLSLLPPNYERMDHGLCAVLLSYTPAKLHRAAPSHPMHAPVKKSNPQPITHSGAPLHNYHVYATHANDAGPFRHCPLPAAMI